MRDYDIGASRYELCISFIIRIIERPASTDSPPAPRPYARRKLIYGSKSISEIDVFTIQDNYSNPVEPTQAQTFSLNGITDFDVQYWNGTSWITVTGGSVTANNKVWRKFTFSAVTTDKVRVLVNNALNSQSRLVEVEAWQGAEGSSNGVDIEWMVSDQLGTVRMIADKTGSLSGIKRHDYLPFGEELFAGTGGRTASQGYSVNDEVRQHFTGKERDNETSLDYFGARYYASTQGRFTSPDPLLGSATVESPQSWNRYTYVLDNPLRYNDPLGLYEWDASAGGSYTDEELEQRRHDRSLKKSERNAAKNALKFRARFRDAMSRGQDIINNSNLTPEQKTQALAAIGSYGQENDQNGVVVGVKSSLGTNVGASTMLNNDGTISVKLLSGHKGNELIVDIAHEGQHVEDADAFLASGAKVGDPTDLTHREREMRAYEITSLTAEAVGLGSAVKGFEEKYQVWNKGWKQTDIESNRSKGIERFVSSPQVGYPANAPGDRYSQEFHPRQ